MFEYLWIVVTVSWSVVWETSLLDLFDWTRWVYLCRIGCDIWLFLVIRYLQCLLFFMGRIKVLFFFFFWKTSLILHWFDEFASYWCMGLKPRTISKHVVIQFLPIHWYSGVDTWQVYSVDTTFHPYSFLVCYSFHYCREK